MIAPLGNVYQAGTLSGNPLAMSAGLATLTVLNENKQLYSELDKKGLELKSRMHEVFQKKGMPHVINQIGSMISIHFCNSPVTDFQSANA
ncbi:aminotransferase class III-fold pyridoxal phosphate-dependent enzyme, partial [Acinetobacter baumannii]